MKESELQVGVWYVNGEPYLGAKFADASKLAENQAKQKKLNDEISARNYAGDIEERNAARKKVAEIGGWGGLRRFPRNQTANLLIRKPEIDTAPKENGHTKTTEWGSRSKMQKPLM